jgi:metal-responsive CopG/Arc/MetJ family transcriptional regulator
MATNRARYMISVDQKMFEDIENFRFIKRYPTRSEATTTLIRLGLEALRKLESETFKSEPDNN